MNTVIANNAETNELVDNSSITVLANKTSSAQTLLATVMVSIPDMNGKLHSCRCLLDSGSQSNIITNSFAAKLGLPRSKINLAVQGISQASLKVSSTVELHLQSQYMDFQCQLSCLVVPIITSKLPSITFNLENVQIPNDILLADKEFNISKDIDLLVGATLFWNTLLRGRKLLNNNLLLHETAFGWVVSGPVPSPISSTFVTTCHFQINKLSDETLTKFWLVEEPELMNSTLSIEERQCEKHFVDNVRFASDGRFIVKIPFNELLSQLGESKTFAHRRFVQLEAKLSRNQSLRTQYVAFMEEYQSLGHMSEISNTNSSFGYYIPHHSVIKDSVSTKLRVVFDASMRSTTGISLNQTQIVGPVVQNDLLSIILRFRQYSFVLTGDIKQMYRQVLLDSSQRRYQRIFWRSDPTQELKTFELKTVTYGTASAPYLATKCLQFLAENHQMTHPTASYAIENDFYVDDFITGSDSVESLICLRKEVSSILSSAQLELRKFMSNNVEVVSDIGDVGDLQVMNFAEK